MAQEAANSFQYTDITDYTGTPTYTTIPTDDILADNSEISQSEPALQALIDGVQEANGHKSVVAFAIKKGSACESTIRTDVEAGTRGVIKATLRNSGGSIVYGASGATAGEGMKMHILENPNYFYGGQAFFVLVGEVTGTHGDDNYYKA